MNKIVIRHISELYKIVHLIVLLQNRHCLRAKLFKIMLRPYCQTGRAFWADQQGVPERLPKVYHGVAHFLPLHRLLDITRTGVDHAIH